MRLPVGGDKISYPGGCGISTADMLLVEILVNSVISKIVNKFMTGGTNNVYPKTPLNDTSMSA